VNRQENGRFAAQVLALQEIVRGVFLEFLFAQFSLYVPIWIQNKNNENKEQESHHF